MPEKIKLIRGQNEGEKTFIEFYPAVWMQRSKDPITYSDGKRLPEMIAREAFDNTDLSNVKAVTFHDRTKILGRTGAGTLTLTRDDYGLLAKVEMGATTLHKDTIEQIVRGDLIEASFDADATRYEDRVIGSETVRVITKIPVMRDASLVGDSAYAGAKIIGDAALKMKREKEEKEEVERIKREKEEAERIKREKENDMPNKMELIREAVARNSGTVVLDRGTAEILQLKRAAADGDTSAMSKLTARGVAPLDIMGKVPIWRELGVDYNPGVTGTYILPYEDPIIGQELAELAAVTGDATTPDGNVISPRRFSAKKTFTIEGIASMGDEMLNRQIQNLEQAADRKVTSAIYAKALAGATEVTGAALTKAGFDLLQGAIDGEESPAYLGSKNTFTKAKSVAIDAGSGRFLCQKVSGSKFRGETYEGDDFFYSPLFKDADKEQYVVYGDMSRIHVADWNKTEVVVDNVTEAGAGKVTIHVRKVMNVALTNPNAFAKTPDLDPAS